MNYFSPLIILILTLPYTSYAVNIDAKEYGGGTDLFQLNSSNFTWLGPGDCVVDYELATQFLECNKTIDECEQICVESDCTGFAAYASMHKCSGSNGCHIYQGEEILEAESSELNLVDPADPLSIEKGNIGCVKVLDKTTQDIQIMNDGIGECRLEDCLVCDAHYDVPDSGCVATDYNDCMQNCMNNERCRGFRWDGRDEEYEKCASLYNATGMGLCEYFQVPKEISIEEALSDEWQVNGTMLHAGHGAECYERNTDTIYTKSSSSSTVSMSLFSVYYFCFVNIFMIVYFMCGIM